MMIRWLYCLLIYLLSPLVLWLLYRPRQGKPGFGRRWPEHLGWVPPVTGPRPLWIHTVSVGESIAALPLIRALRQQYPQLPLLVTTTTRTGADQVARLGDLVTHRYAPLDYPGAVARFLRRTRPCGLLIMETELWPNWLAACERRGLPVAVLNARLSERSCQGYQRFGHAFARLTRVINPLLCQYRGDAARFARLGIGPERLAVTGSLKFDIQLDEALVAQGQALHQGLGGRPVLIAASTHQGEDEPLLAAFATLLQHRPDALLVLVPRHPQRFDAVAALCQREGFVLARRSLEEEIVPQTQIYLGDTMGEMPLLLQLADVAFMGGSLVPVGGHNLLEPAALGKPCLIGPHFFNFQDITRQLVDCGGAQIVEEASALPAVVLALWQDEAARQAMGTAAFDVVAANQGALARTLGHLAPLLTRLQAEATV